MGIPFFMRLHVSSLHGFMKSKSIRVIKFFILGVNGLLFVFIFIAMFARGKMLPERSSLAIDIYDQLPTQVGKMNSNTHSAEESFPQPKRVVELLQYDDFMNRDFHLGGESINLLLFYWSPGKVENNRILSHTPDVCWTRKGWQQIDEGNLMPEQIASSLELGADSTLAQNSWLSAFGSYTSRCFAFGNQKTFVYYALFDGGEIVAVEDPLTARFKKVFLDSLNPKKAKGAKPKFYVRFTSNDRPIEWWMEQEEFRSLLRQIHLLTQGNEHEDERA